MSTSKSDTNVGSDPDAMSRSQRKTYRVDSSQAIKLFFLEGFISLRHEAFAAIDLCMDSNRGRAVLLLSDVDTRGETRFKRNSKVNHTRVLFVGGYPHFNKYYDVMGSPSAFQSMINI